MNDITKEAFSSLLAKYMLIMIEITKLQAYIVYYSDAGNKLKLSQLVDSIKRLEMSKAAVALEIDRRMENRQNDDNLSAGDLVPSDG